MKQRNPGRPRRADGRTILVIASAFPPVGGSGVQRPAKFAKYLARSGWRVIVWTAGAVPGLPRDDGLLDDLPDNVERYEIPVLDPEGRAAALADALGRRLYDWPRLRRVADAAAWRAGRQLKRMLAWSIPDEQTFWVVRSFRELRRLVRLRGVDVILSTFSPASNHLLAYLLRRADDVPWVADFRDLWTDDCAYVPRSRLHRRLDGWLEHRFLKSADAVVSVSPSQTRLLADHVPDQRDKFHTITNGVDLEDFEGRPPHRHDPDTLRDRFILACVGHLQSDRFNPAHVEGLARFSRRTHEWGGRFEFRVVGRVSEALRRRLQDADVQPSITGPVNHAQAVAEMVSAHVLLLPTAPGRNGDSLIPAKLFEYLASGRPILVTGEERAEPWRIVSDLGAGVRADLDPAAIDAALTRLWRRWRCGALPPGADRKRLEPYHRENLTLELEGVLARVMQPTQMALAPAPAPSQRATIAPAPLPNDDPASSAPPGDPPPGGTPLRGVNGRDSADDADAGAEILETTAV